MVRGAPGRGSSSNPSTRRVTKRARQRPTIWGETRSFLATVWLSRPRAHAKTMRARRATWGAVRARWANESSACCSGVVNTNGTFGRPIIGTSCVRGTTGATNLFTKLQRQDTSAGAAYVFVRSGGSWSQQAYLKASNTFDNNLFGSSVAVDGDTVVVGAPGENSNATGVDGDQANNSAGDAGAVYVFVRSGGAGANRRI